MSQLVVGGISELFVVSESGATELLTDAAFIVENGVFTWIGKDADLPATLTIDCKKRAVIPGFVDSHTHLIFAGDRVSEFEARMAGNPYEAGGIMSTVRATRAASDEELFDLYKKRAQEMLRNGITTFETKSGYGLSVNDELRSLKIASMLTDEVTVLAAHVVPTEFKDKRSEYVKLVIEDILPEARKYASWVDVFCDEGAFTIEETRSILKAATTLGYKKRLHANQLKAGDGVKLGIDLGCVSIDHCSHLSSEDISALAESGVVSTLLPIAEFSTRSTYPNARALIDAGVNVALSTDCNPGSSYSTSMSLAIALAVRDMGMTPSEAIKAATFLGAKALEREDIGAIALGKRADFLILDAPSHAHIAYRPGVDLISQVFKAGELVLDKGMS
jgi:imidazolonepropionase